MEYQQQISNLTQALAERNDQIAQFQLEAEGAAQTVQSAQAELAATRQAAQQSAHRIAELENELRCSQVRVLTPCENVLKKLQTPNILRDLPHYDGNPIKLHQFIRSIDNLMPVIDEARGTPMYSVWIQCIRSKIVGDADTILELYGTELSWNEIKSNLIAHYNDKRDEISLTRDLFRLSQTGTVEEFYGKVSHIISLLLNNLCITETNGAILTSKKKFYKEIGLKVFLAGLKEPLGPIIRAQSPETMKEALRLCAEESNYNYVKNPFKTYTPPVPPKPQHQPYQQAKPPQFPPTFKYPTPKPPQNYFYPQTKPIFPNPHNPFQMQPNPFKTQHSPFKTQPNHNPFKMQHNNNPFKPLRPPQFHNQNNFAQRQNPQTRPEPMDVDSSIRSHRVNYMNRPNFHMQFNPADYGYYPEPADNNYFYYQGYDNLLNSSPTEHTASRAVETFETTEENNEQETTETEQNADDLNFQFVSDIPEAT